MMLMGGKVTIAGSGAVFGTVMAATARASGWCALVSVAAFAGAALIGSLVPRWWPATIGGFLFVLAVLNYLPGEEIFDLGAGDSYGVAANFGSANWLTVTGNLRSPGAFGHWHLVPTVIPIAMICLFAAGVAWAFERKELK
jgi:hypothetical protein